jgi:hypothetical protein
VKRTQYAVLVIGCAVAAAAGCGSGRTVGGGNTDTPTNVNFATQIQPIFTRNCAITGCHAADTASQGLILAEGQAHANLVNVESTEVPPRLRVEPGNSAGSYMYEKISQAQPTLGARMPLGSNLPGDEIELIRIWIDEGAQP